jgi:hypothetical protein
MTPREQRLRNETGQQAHSLKRMTEQRREMQADLVRQREDMQNALLAIGRGEIREAMDILQDALTHRERTREQRKPSPTTA